VAVARTDAVGATFGVKLDMASDAREVLLQYMVCNGKYNGIPRIR
jgi:hypothetical protein